MKKKSDLFFAFIKIPLDFFILIMSGVLAYLIRYDENIQTIRPIVFDLPFEKYFSAVVLTSIVCLFCFAISGLYSFTRRKITDEIAKIILATSSGLTAIILYMFFVREFFSSRFIVLIAWIISCVLISLGRLVIRELQLYSQKIGWGTHNVVVIGGDKNTEKIIETFNYQKELGYKIIGRIKTFETTDKESLKKLHQEKFIDEIIQADSSLSRKLSIELIDFCNSQNIIFKYAAGQFESMTTNIEVHVIAGVPIIEIKKTKLDGWGRIAKRILDVIFSFILLIIFAPLMLLIALAIRLEDWGPAIYKNERVSKNKNFNVYKFRSMYVKYCTGSQFAKYIDPETTLKMEKHLIKKQSARKGPVYKVVNDPRRTKIGRFLERTSLDELPQFFNVLVGNMSLVGPRPHQPREVAKYADHHRRVLDIKPGISGLAQISGRSDLDFEDEVKLDTYYIENWSLKQDFWIMIKTPISILRRKTKS
ncbi:MAG: sugar transferase [Patescibacteria group bacterium]